MTHPSPPELLLLHAIRLRGFADTHAAAWRAGISPDDAESALRDAESHHLVQQLAFADLQGWSLTDKGRKENERLLARERTQKDPDGRIAAVHHDFLPFNARLVRTCSDWQLRPTADDALAPNDHADASWDARILEELAALSDGLAPLVRRLSAVLARFAGYDTRFATALRRAQDGEREWVDGTGVDSCHRVWFELHEDLIATLGIDRAAEGSGSSA